MSTPDTAHAAKHRKDMRDQCRGPLLGMFGVSPGLAFSFHEVNGSGSKCPVGGGDALLAALQGWVYAPGDQGLGLACFLRGH